MDADVQQIEYRSGMLEHGTNPEALPVRTWRCPEIPEDVRLSIGQEKLLDLAGVYGIKEAGDPIEYDCLRLHRADEVIKITVYNRGITLFSTDDERVRRIHRVICKLDSMDASS